MTKPFNIHDWQAKQRQQLLTEAEINPDPKERLVQTIVNVLVVDLLTGIQKRLLI